MSPLAHAAHTVQLAAVAAGASVGGAAIEYLLDPDRGHARRVRLRDGLRSRSRALIAEKERSAFRAFHHALDPRVGELRRSVAHLRGQSERYDDVTLAQKVRSEALGRLDKDLRGRVSVDATSGVVNLRGEIDSEHDRSIIAAAVARVEGVERVVNLLHASGEDAPNKSAVRHLHEAS
ncbi:MAG: hypothetical protein JWM85_1362 [Acidimicrobiaceae bacterium]|nr:hypothetical protein [Acidimicrobiaceae bacterium]